MGLVSHHEIAWQLDILFLKLTHLPVQMYSKLGFSKANLRLLIAFGCAVVYHGDDKFLIPIICT